MAAATIDDMKCVREVARIAKSLGGRALLVGGCVRDAMLGAETEDFDLEVYGVAPDRLKDALSGTFRLDLVGASFSFDIGLMIFSMFVR